jgi:hypothetical protein
MLFTGVSVKFGTRTWPFLAEELGASTTRLNFGLRCNTSVESLNSGGGGLGMLAFLQRWAREHNIRFLLFHPSKAVEGRLRHARSIAEFHIASLEEMWALLAYANSRYAFAA